MSTPTQATPLPGAGATPSREQLREHLLVARIAGDVATPRESNLANARKAARCDELYTFGLEWDERWSYLEIVAMMAERVGIDPDVGRTDGSDVIDVELTLDGLDAMAQRLREVAAARGTVLLASGHPTGMIAVQLRIARALLAAGCTLLTPAAGWSYESQGRVREVRYLGGVACLSDGAALLHTHSPTPMRAILTSLHEERDNLPDLVVADHGYAGAAAQAGARTVGFADCNDPALFIGAAEGTVEVAVPLDDNVGPHLYEPVADYLLAGIPDRPGAASA